MINLSELIQKFESWPEPVQPPFTDIKEIGCCEEHEQAGDFIWYREHRWQDLRDIFLCKIVDPEMHSMRFNIDTLDPSVFRYYMKGALSALAQEVERSSSFDELDWGIWRLIERDKEYLERFKGRESIGLGHSKKEVGDIIELIKHIGKLDTESLSSVSPGEEITDTLSYWNAAYAQL